MYNKYSSKKTTVDNIKFDSKKEANRYLELKLLEKTGKIYILELQPKYLLQERFTDNTGKKHREINYIADFRYIENDKIIVEDTKGFRTEVYKIKKKILLYKYKEIIFKEL